MGICQTGNLDIEIGEPAPTITNLAGMPTTVGKSAVVTATVTGEYTGINWVVKDGSGNDVTSTVATLTPVSGHPDQVTLAWQPNSQGTYQLCGTPVATDATLQTRVGQYCQDVTVYPNVELTITQSEGTCAGTEARLTVTATDGSALSSLLTAGSYKWKKDGTVISGQTGDQITVTLGTGDGAYTFEATTKDNKSVTANYTVAGVAGPAIGNIVATLPSSATISNGGSYNIGDEITLSLSGTLPGNAAYAWTVNNVPGNEATYLIPSASAGGIEVSVSVAINNGCPATSTAKYNFNTGCGLAVALKDHFTQSTSSSLCSNGTVLLDAEVSNNGCGSTMAVSFILQKKSGSDYTDVETQTASSGSGSSLKKTFAVTVAGTYRIKVETNRGYVVSEDYNVNAISTTAGTLATFSPMYIPTGAAGASLQLGASSTSQVDGWYWMPENYFSDNTLQYPQTNRIYNPMTFTVYAKAGSCVETGEVQVLQSNNSISVEIQTYPMDACVDGKVRMTAVVTGASQAEEYEYTWGVNDYNAAVDRTQKELVFDVLSGQFDPSNPVITQTVFVKGKTTQISGLATATVQLKNIPNPLLGFDLSTYANGMCEGTQLTVNPTSTGNLSNVSVSKYHWYTLDAEGNRTYSTSNSPTNTLTMSKRGDYTVWVGAEVTKNGQTCYSDTANSVARVTVKGFDLTWDPMPQDMYKSGDCLTAGVKGNGGTGDYTIEWTSPGTLRETKAEGVASVYTVEGASKDQYVFSGTMTNDGCSKNFSETVNRISPDNGLMLSLGSKTSVLCPGGSGVMTASFHGGTSPYNVTWYRVGSENSPLASKTGVLAGSDSYFAPYADFSNGDKVVVKVTDGNSPTARIRRDTVTIDKKAAGTAAAPVISAGSDRIIGKGTSTYLLGTVAAGSVAVTTWNWYDESKLASEKNTATPKTVALQAAETYTAYATSADGCTSNSSSVTISVTDQPYDLSVTANVSGVMCRKSSVPVSATVAPEGRNITAYNWEAGVGTLSDATAISPTWTMPSSLTNGTTYVCVMVTDENNVTAVDRKQVTVQAGVAPTLQFDDLAEVDGENVMCSGYTELILSDANGALLSNQRWYDQTNHNSPMTDFDGKDRCVITLKAGSDDSTMCISASAISSQNSCPASNVVTKCVTVYPRPEIAWSMASTADPVNPSQEVEAIAMLTKETAPNYTYVWTHTGSGSGTSFTQTHAGDMKSDTSKLVGVSAEATQPYMFQVSVLDGRECVSETISRSVYLNGDAIYVGIDSKYGAFCDGGSVVLKATPRNAAEPVQYTWLQGATELAETGDELFIASPVAGATYFVKVVDANGKEGQSAEFALAEKTPDVDAATLTGVDMKIPKNTRTALVATPSAPITEWHWEPENKLAAGESTLPSPYTVKLSSNTTYTVYGVDANSCVTNEATVRVNVSTINTGGTDTMMVRVVPSADTICVGNELGLTATLYSNSLTLDGSFVWTGEPALTSVSSNNSRMMFNANNDPLAPGVYTYTVTATTSGTNLKAADRAVITVINSNTPVLTENQEGARCVGSNVVVTLAPEVAGAKYIWIKNGQVENGVTGNTYVWPDDANGQTIHLQAIAVTPEGCRTKDTVDINETIAAGTELDGLEVADSCGLVKVYAVGDASASYSWNLTGAGLLKEVSQLSEDTCYIRIDGALTDASATYTIDVVKTPGQSSVNKCTATGSHKGKVYRLPMAKIADWTKDGSSYPYMMAEKGKDSEAAYEDMTSGNVEGGNSTTSWDGLGGTIAPVAGSAPNAYLQNLTADGEVRLTVENKEDASCLARDTMPVYLYPSKPDLEIDTINGSFVNAVLKMKGATNYTVYSRKWDPYCLTTRFTGDQKYNAEPTATNLSSTSMNAIKRWEEPNMDTLEFYYAVAARTITYAGRNDVWNSPETSDTVGYYLQDFHVNAGGLMNDDYLPLYFDFDAMSLRNSSDLFARLVPNIESYSYIFNFDYNTQETSASTLRPNGKVLSPFSLVNGTVLQVRPEKEVKFMQYGYLPRRYSFDIKKVNGDIGDYNWIFTLPQKADALEMSELLAGDFRDVQYIVRWSFSSQETYVTTFRNGKILGSSDAKMALKPLMFLKVQLGNSTSLLWH